MINASGRGTLLDMTRAKADPALPGPELYQRAAQLAQALSSPARLKLLNTLAQAPRGVDALAARLGQSAATTSAQLKVLLQAGLVRRRAEGQRAIYSLDAQSERAWLGLRDHALESATDLQQRAELLAPAYAGELSGVTDLARRRKLTLVDLRPEDEWRAGHLPAARHIPFEQLPGVLDGLPRSKRYLVYCTGPLCSKAIQGTRQLIDAGLHAVRLPAGVAEWQHAGLALESDTEVH